MTNMTNLGFEGRVAIVTGAGRGIGRAHALLLASRGASVVVADLGGQPDGTGIDSEPADGVVAEIVAAGGRAVASYSSVADPDGARSIVDCAIQQFGRVDILINNAGIFGTANFADLSLEQFRRMMNVHYFGSLMVTKVAWPYMVQAGYGRIVNTTSEVMFGVPGMSDYGAAKGAVFGLTRNLAVEGRELGVLVNCISPRAGTRMVDMLAGVGRSREQTEAMKRYMPPEHVASAAAFLAHESCSLTGETLQVGHGEICRIAAVRTRGYSGSELTPEIVAQEISAILDMEDSAPLEWADQDAEARNLAETARIHASGA